MIGNHRAFNLEEEENVARLMVERLEIALALGNDQVGIGETLAEFWAAILQ